jgi:hypothetical protein
MASTFEQVNKEAVDNESVDLYSAVKPVLRHPLMIISPMTKKQMRQLLLHRCRFIGTLGRK